MKRRRDEQNKEGNIQKGTPSRVFIHQLHCHSIF